MNATLRRLAASVVVTGFRDAQPEPGFDDVLRAYPFAGFIFFDRNGTSVGALRALADTLRARYEGPPPILAIDQEGGRVMRLREGVAPMPPAAQIGASGDEALAERIGAQCALDLRRAGCNLDFAPVLDLAVNPGNTVIGDRSFGSDPAAVARMALAFARGLERGGVVATYKHFPGHGATAVDSHHALPVVEVDEATLRTRDLVPFAAVAGGARAMMTAHVVVRALDPDRPATLSRRILQTLLREELGFRGVCFTDCLQMAAIADGAGSTEGALEALRAGADALTVSHDPMLAIAIVERVERAVEEGDLAPQRLQEAAARIDALRAQLQPPLPV
ncbi:MAG TPA: beta-N-acetylhexosaminidase [Candidatus Tyrphobacter sp.]